MKIVKIVWIDSRGVTSDWEFKDEIKPFKPILVTTVGYLLEDNAEYKTLAQSDSEKMVTGLMAIPVCCIKKIEELVVKEINEKE